MAQQSAASQLSRDNAPPIHVGAPNDGVLEMLEALEQRAFEIFESNGHSFGHDMADWQQAERELLHPAHIEISESDQKFTMQAEAPGFAAKDLEVSIEGRRVIISGKREKHEERKGAKTVYSETCSNQLLRVLDLPADLNAHGAKANLKDGILQLEIPKAAPAKKVPVAAPQA